MSFNGTPPGPARKPLRHDPEGWQIEDDSVAEHTLRALEAAGLIVLEMVFHRLSNMGLDLTDHDLDLALRGLGTLAGRVGMTRLAWMTGTDGAGNKRASKADDADAEAVGEAMRRVLQWLLIWDPTNPDAPPSFAPPSAPRPTVRLDLDELHAAAIYLDRRARAQGVSGPGSRRRMVRTTTRSSS